MLAILVMMVIVATLMATPIFERVDGSKVVSAKQSIAAA
jgi:hypothetical protein